MAKGITEVISDFTVEREKIYKQGKLDGAKEFTDALRVNFDLLAWNNSDEVIDYTLAEWQKGTENELGN